MPRAPSFLEFVLVVHKVHDMPVLSAWPWSNSHLAVSFPSHLSSTSETHANFAGDSSNRRGGVLRGVWTQCGCGAPAQTPPKSGPHPPGLRRVSPFPTLGVLLWFSVRDIVPAARSYNFFLQGCVCLMKVMLCVTLEHASAPHLLCCIWLHLVMLSISFQTFTRLHVN